MKPTTDEPRRLDYSRARLEAMPITIDLYSEEATRLFTPSEVRRGSTPGCASCVSPSSVPAPRIAPLFGA